MRHKQDILQEAVNRAIMNVISERRNANNLDIIVETVVRNQINILKEDSMSKKQKRRAVLEWLRSPEIDTAEIRRMLEGEPENQREEDTKRSLFMKKVNQTYGKRFSDEEINKLYSIKTGLGQ